jgi:hypothetical protein
VPMIANASSNRTSGPRRPVSGSAVSWELADLSPSLQRAFGEMPTLRSCGSTEPRAFSGTDPLLRRAFLRPCFHIDA